MSELIRTVNRIKAARDSSWLTTSQRHTWKELQEAIRIPGTVNLFGSIGVGKTFVAWHLVEQLGYAYFPHPTYLRRTEQADMPGVIIDNAESTRAVHREILKLLQFCQIRSAVLVTREPVEDYTRYVHLMLTEEDVDKVRMNLTAINIFPSADRVSDLWALVRGSILGG